MRKPALLVAFALALTSCAPLGFSGGCGGTEVMANFEQVGDLVEAADVQSSDVEIGTIQEIELDESEWHAQVTLCLDSEEEVPRDVEAVIRTTSLLGEKFVDLKPQSTGPPFLEDGDIIGVESTSKATELEDVFARLGLILGTGNLEELNRFTAAQAKILDNNAGELKEVLSRLRRFTDTLVSRKGDIAASIDSLDDVSRTALQNTQVLQRFLDSFGEASGVLADQKEGLQDLLVALDEFTDISIRLLHATDQGLTKQFAKLRPVLQTVVNNGRNLERTIATLATFSDWFPETMPGDYLQLDVCQALETTTQGTTCPQSDRNDREAAAGSRAGSRDGDAGSDDADTGDDDSSEPSTGDLETILRVPLEERD